MADRGDGFPERVFSEAGYQPDYQRIIRTNKGELIYVPSDKDKKIMKGSPFELYDIEQDPEELTNVIETESQIAGKLKGAGS